jgi:hypothetical protein
MHMVGHQAVADQRHAV